MTQTKKFFLHEGDYIRFIDRAGNRRFGRLTVRPYGRRLWATARDRDGRLHHIPSRDRIIEKVDSVELGQHFAPAAAVLCTSEDIFGPMNIADLDSAFTASSVVLNAALRHDVVDIREPSNFVKMLRVQL